jgi:hypothetical protein
MRDFSSDHSALAINSATVKSLDLKGLIEVWIVQQTFPSNGSPRLLEVDAHHGEQFVGKLSNRTFQKLSVFARGFSVVNGAGADYN